MSSGHEALEGFLGSAASSLVLFEGVSDDRWLVRPDGEEWSLAETVEHVVLTNRATLARFEQHPSEAAVARDAPRLSDDQITKRMFHRVAAPPGLAAPTGRFATAAEGVASLTAVRDGIAEYVRGAAHGLRSFRAPHPMFGIFDGVQWVLR